MAEDDREKVREATNIVDLIASVTTVKRSGRNQMAICPFHQEKTPSMSIDAARGLYYCHGCHAKGDVFTFVQESEGLNFHEALEYLAKRAGIVLTVDPRAREKQGKRHALVEVIGEAADFYHRTLMKSADAGHARSYLRSRGYDSDVVAEFKLGYAPGKGDSLVKELRARQISDRVMVEAGLARKGKSGYYDYFRDRLLFPTWDVRGEMVGFGGRILGEGQPKYLNTPETPVYKKSHLLYGLDRARREITRAGYAVVVEGYTDVIALHRSGMKQAVATNGTALGNDHFDLLRRFTDRIVLAFDADAAGGRAALRGDQLEIPVNLDLDLRVAEIPTGLDPAELVQKGRFDEVVEAVEKSVALLQYRIERDLDKYDISEPEARARALKSLAPRISKVSDPLARREYARFLADRLRVDLESVEEAMGRRRGGRRGPSNVGKTYEGRERFERELLRAVLADGGAAFRAGISVEHFRDNQVRSAFREIEETLKSTPEGAPVPFPQDSELNRLLIELNADSRPLTPLSDLLEKLRRMEIDQQIAELQAKLEGLSLEDQGSSKEAAELIRLLESKRAGR